MTTLQNVIDETLSILLTTSPDALNKLTTTIDASTPTVVMTEELKALTAGKYFSLGLEDFYIWEATTATKTLRCQRAMHGSTAAAHTAGDLALVSPKFSPFQVMTAINNELRSLPAQGIFAVATLELTYLSSRNSYDLTGVTSIDRVLDVSYDEPGSTQQWPSLRSWKLRRAAETSDFASGYALTLFESAYSGRQLRVTYSHGFNTLFAALSDTLTTIGLQDSAADILSLGAALRLSGYRELARNLHEGQGDPRRAGEVQTRAQIASMEPYLRMYARRVGEEARQFISDWPYRYRVPA